MGMPSSVHELKTLVLSFHPIVAIETVEEERARDLIRLACADLGLPIFEWSLLSGLRRRGEGPMLHKTQEPLAMLRHIQGLTVEAVFLLKDLPRHLSDPAAARQLRELGQKFARSSSTLVLTGESVRLPPEVEHQAVYYPLRLPHRDELKRVLEATVQSLRRNRSLRIDLRPGELADVLRALSGMTLNQARQAIAFAILEDGKLDSSDIGKILERKAKALREGGLLEYFAPQDNSYQLGGFRNLRKWLQRAAAGFSEEAAKLNLSPPRGILLTGVQGCGKSLAAKTIARDWQLPLLKLEAGRLYDKYIGESEKNFRKASDAAESMAPSVLWIDEIEKGFAAQGGDMDGGLSRRLLGSFLTWLQEKRRDVFVVATANDISALPPELMRKGRFDEVFFVDLPDGDERKAILRIHLALKKQDHSRFDLASLTEASEGFSGAELEQAVISGLYRALHVKRPLDTPILLEELGQTVPLSSSRREEIERLREHARRRFVPAN